MVACFDLMAARIGVTPVPVERSLLTFIRFHFINE
jgi:hypothetical protein